MAPYLVLWGLGLPPYHEILCDAPFQEWPDIIIPQPQADDATHPSQGGVLERANFHATACFCLLRFIGVLRCQCSRLLVGICPFCRKTPQIPLSELEAMKNQGSQLWQNRRRRANVRQTRADSGRRPANVGHVRQGLGGRHSKKTKNKWRCPGAQKNWKTRNGPSKSNTKSVWPSLGRRRTGNPNFGLAQVHVSHVQNTDTYVCLFCVCVCVLTCWVLRSGG